MGLIALAIVVVAALVFAYLYQPKQQQQEMAPASLDSFQVTLANEATVVSVFYGRVRKRGNIVYYGNLETTPIIEETGGKGGGSQSVIAGYKYYLDIWQVIGMGKASIIQTWIQDNLKVVDASATVYNDGTQSTYPDQPGENANALRGLCHVFYDRMFLGDNVTYVPTVHFLMERDMSTSPVNNAVMTKGTNPAAIIYDLHMLAGASPTDMNLTAFNAAAGYWYNKGYCLNIDITRQTKLRDMVAQILSYVDGAYGVDGEGKFYIKAFDENDSSVATMEEDDFKEFVFTRKAWNKTFNDFRANYTDEDKDYTVRTIAARNKANIGLQGRKKPRSVDLTGYRTLTLASQRLWEVMKKESYPDAQITCKTTLKFDEVLVGQVVTINHSEYGISSAEFRVINKDVSTVDQNVIGWRLIQMTETLFDDNFEPAGGPGWVTPDYSPEALVHQHVFELPWNPITGYERSYLLLAARENDHDTGFIVMTSNTGVDYIQRGACSGWAQRGLLKVAYNPANHPDIDDEEGIIYEPYREDPVFDDLSRTDLFSKNRFILIGSEIMRFQNSEPYETTKIKLTGIVRGVLNTTQATHNVNDEVWLFDLSDNVLTGITSDDFYVKMLPFFTSEVVSESAADAEHVVPTDKALEVWPPYRLVVSRSGSSCTAEWWPTNKDSVGAGMAGTSQLDADPMLYDQDFDTIANASSQIVAGTTRSYTDASQHTFQVRARKNGRVSSYISVTVGTGDGDYYSTGW